MEQHPIPLAFVGRTAETGDNSVIQFGRDDQRIPDKQRSLAREASENGVDRRTGDQRRHHMRLLPHDFRQGVRDRRV